MTDLDKIDLEIECPLCKFYNYIFLKQVRIRDVIICRGCNINIKLDDYMNRYQSTKNKIEKQMRELKNILDIDLKINL